MSDIEQILHVTTQYSTDYIEGVYEGRSLAKQFKLDGILNAETIKEHLLNLESILETSQPLQVVEMIEGERDYFEHALKGLGQ